MLEFLCDEHFVMTAVGRHPPQKLMEAGAEGDLPCQGSIKSEIA